MSKADKLYARSPRMKRDEESGEMGVTKPDEADVENMGIGGDTVEGNPGEMPVDVHQASERHEVHHRHVHEHLSVHKRHEAEHRTHKGDKAALHKKHEAEIKEMHDRHHEELKSMHKRHLSTGEMSEGRESKKEKE